MYAVFFANFPLFLLASIVICLTIFARRLANQNYLAKSLESVESLGSSSIVCCDKTGTLTQNRVVVAHMWFDNQIIEIDPSDTGSELGKHSHGWKALSNIAALCNSAEFKSGQDGKPIMDREVNGDAVEAALLKYCEMTSGNVTDCKKRNKKVCEVPLSSSCQMSIHETVDRSDPRYLVLMTGSPESVLERCTSIYVNDEHKPLEEDLKDAILYACTKLRTSGEKVFAYCDHKLPTDKYPLGFPFDAKKGNFPVQGFRFVGLISFVDPLRASAPNAVATCISAGVKVILVTGDDPVTATAIGRSVGIISDGSKTAQEMAIGQEQVNPSDAKATVVVGSQLEGMSPVELDTVIR